MTNHELSFTHFQLDVNDLSRTIFHQFFIFDPFLCKNLRHKGIELSGVYLVCTPIRIFNILNGSLALLYLFITFFVWFIFLMLIQNLWYRINNWRNESYMFVRRFLLFSRGIIVECHFLLCLILKKFKTRIFDNRL